MSLSKTKPAQLQTTDVETHGALTQLRALLAQQDYQSGSRLPSERNLCADLGVNRNALRKALAILEEEGQIWRHVGRGTFVGPSNIAIADETKVLSSQSNPTTVMEARLAMEPELAGLAALHATADDIAQMEICVANSKAAQEWRVYETWDNRLHRTIAEASHNALLLSLFDTLNTVRRTVVWGRLRTTKPCPGPEHHSHADHELIVQAIRDRDISTAQKAMRTHLEAVRNNLLHGNSR